MFLSQALAPRGAEGAVSRTSLPVMQLSRANIALVVLAAWLACESLLAGETGQDAAAAEESSQAQSSAQMAGRIDALLDELWSAEQIEPVPLAGDGQFLRRAHFIINKPHFKVAVDFANANAEGIGANVALTVTDPISELTAIAQPGTSRTVLALGATRLEMFAQNLTAGMPPAQAAAASQIRLMVHDRCDALGELLDSDADGRLGERDVATSAQSLLTYDANHDGQLQNNELPYSMIVAFLRGERPGDDSFYRPRSEAARPALAGAPAWFIRADFNGDGDISRREFLGTGDQFSRLDANRDDFINATEAAVRRE